MHRSLRITVAGSATSLLVLIGAMFSEPAGAREVTLAEVAVRIGESAFAGTEGAKLFAEGGLSGLFERLAVTDQLALYSLELRLGAGEFDRIGLHRLVREVAPGVPTRPRRAVLFVHGDRYDFSDQFMTNLLLAEASPSRSLPAFLAANGIDVWGVDLRWTQVPADVADLDFMEGWGLELMSEDVGKALALARVVRIFEGSGFARPHVLGYSRGGQIAYAYLGREAAMRRELRQAGGLIIVDSIWQVDDPGKRQAECDSAVTFQDDFAAGERALDFRFLSTIGVLAETEPDAPSPILAGFTNFQASLFFATFSDDFGFHFLGGSFDAQGRPTGLLYADEDLALEAAKAVRPYSPLRLRLDVADVICGQIDVPFDDAFAAVEVPVLYIGAAGGFHELGAFSARQLGSDDITTEVIGLLSPEERAIDLGHSDIVIAAEAESLFWQPILSWILAR